MSTTTQQQKNPLWEYYQSNQNRNAIHKWFHHFDLFHQYFKHFLEQQQKDNDNNNSEPIILIEIGVQNGGSLNMWKNYFSSLNALIYGIDINEKIMNIPGLDENITVFIGDQSNSSFLNYVIRRIGKSPHIIIDDGGHYPLQQKTSFEILYPLLAPNGLYICENTSTSYINHFQSPSEINFMGWIKNTYFDTLNREFLNTSSSSSSATTTTQNEQKQKKFFDLTKGFHVYPNFIVFERNELKLPTFQNALIGLNYLTT